MITAQEAKGLQGKSVERYLTRRIKEAAEDGHGSVFIETRHAPEMYRMASDWGFDVEYYMDKLTGVSIFWE